jgi:hypothetical protein
MPLSSYLGYITPILQVSFKSPKLGPKIQKYGLSPKNKGNIFYSVHIPIVGHP